MERQHIIKNILQEGLNLPKPTELRTSKVDRLIQAFQNDVRDVAPGISPQIYMNGPIVTFYDSVRWGVALTVELKFSLLRGPESIGIRYNTYKPSYIGMDKGVELFNGYITMVQQYHKVAEHIAENFHTYQDNYRDVKKGRKPNVN